MPFPKARFCCRKFTITAFLLFSMCFHVNSESHFMRGGIFTVIAFFAFCQVFSHILFMGSWIIALVALLRVLKCLSKWSTLWNAELQWLHLCNFSSRECFFKCCFKSPAWIDAYSHFYMVLYGFIWLFLYGPSMGIWNRRRTHIDCIYLTSPHCVFSCGFSDLVQYRQQNHIGHNRICLLDLLHCGFANVYSSEHFVWKRGHIGSI